MPDEDSFLPPEETEGLPSDPDEAQVAPSEMALDAELQEELATHPHDAYFKRVFSDPVQARAFFRRHLPEALASTLDWPGLVVEPGSFVARSLHQTHSDLLFSVPANGKPVLLYLLFEHQTRVDRLMPLRLLGYMVEIWHRWTEAHGVPLPPVVPFVLHQGPERWTVSNEFADLFGTSAEWSAELREYLPKFRHALFDLSVHEPKDEEPERALRLILHLMKMARERRVVTFFEWLAGQVGALPEPLLTLSLLYALHSDDELDVEEIYRTLHHQPQLQSTTMSLAQKLKNQGREEGREVGREEGREVGREEGREVGREEGREVGEWIGKVRLLEELMGGSPTPKTTLEGLEVADLEQMFLRLQEDYNGRFKKT